MIIPLIREVPAGILRRRPSEGKWSAYEHAIHLSQSDVAFRARFDLILSETEPFIRTIVNPIGQDQPNPSGLNNETREIFAKPFGCA